MAPSLEPCPCQNCKGALVSHRTVLCHAATNHTNQPIPTFNEWIAAAPERLNKESDGSSEGNYDGMDGIEEEKVDRERRSDSLIVCKICQVQQYTPMNEYDVVKHKIQVNDDYSGPTGTPINRPDNSDTPVPPDREPEIEEEDEYVNPQQEEDDFEAEPDITQNLGSDPTNEHNDQGNGHHDMSRIEHVRTAQKFIAEISCVTYRNSKLDESTIEHLENPLEDIVNITDPDIRLSLDLFLSCGNASEETYNSVCRSILTRFPDAEVLSYYMVKKVVADITGVYAISDDMCINSCHGFTGPFSDLKNCKICNEPRFDPTEYARSGKEIPRKQECSIPLGPQLQAIRWSKEGAEAILYHDKKTAEVIEAFNNAQLSDELIFDDAFCGQDYQDLAEKLSLTEDDTTVILSIDGAQLYQNKKSDTWFATSGKHKFSYSPYSVLLMSGALH